MDHYERFSRESERHRVKTNRDSIQIWTIDSTRKALERFQSVARDAIEHEHNGYEIIMQHKSNLYGGGLYDSFILKKLPFAGTLRNR